MIRGANGEKARQLLWLIRIHDWMPPSMRRVGEQRRGLFRSRHLQSLTSFYTPPPASSFFIFSLPLE